MFMRSLKCLGFATLINFCVAVVGSAAGGSISYALDDALISFGLMLTVAYVMFLLYLTFFDPWLRPILARTKPIRWIAPLIAFIAITIGLGYLASSDGEGSMFVLIHWINVAVLLSMFFYFERFGSKIVNKQ